MLEKSKLDNKNLENDRTTIISSTKDSFIARVERSVWEKRIVEVHSISALIEKFKK